MKFSEILDILIDGAKVTRYKWNENDLLQPSQPRTAPTFVVYQKGYPQGIPCNKQTADAWGMNEEDIFVCNPYLQIQNNDGSHSMWTPTTDDILATDWVVIEDE